MCNEVDEVDEVDGPVGASLGSLLLSIFADPEGYRSTYVVVGM